VPRRWWLVALIPPAAILLVLELLDRAASPDYRPGFLVFGAAAGLASGFFEELGWTGFAYPRLSSRFGALPGALFLGVLWGVWHLPVVDSLGAASPHGAAWPAFFAAFVAALVALRVLISWAYTSTGSLRLAQLLHASSTGSLVVLGAPGVTPGQEAVWYAAYAALLWVIVALVLILQGPGLGDSPTNPHEPAHAGRALASRADERRTGRSRCGTADARTAGNGATGCGRS
jgi:membrane protease YdiL (CAAX protease family)